MSALRAQHTAEAFSEFVTSVEPKLKHALVALYGVDDGLEATAEALAYAWEHWEKLGEMNNPAGYLYRVGRSRTRRIRRPTPTLHAAPVPVSTLYEPGLPAAISGLSDRQRVAVMLVHGFGWTQAEAGELMGIAATSVQKHIERALKKLRKDLGATA